MGNKNKRSQKIGARCLTRQEAIMILPTYEQIYGQLETFRKEKSTLNSNDQKTNNIGIIGVRGAGKTSVLKTIRAKLERNGWQRGGWQENESQENEPQDIILPIIVPENMSESSTLMATVLGMISDIVHKRAQEKKAEKKAKGVCYIRETELEQKCHNVLKQYTYIQKDYRDILIQQFTSENDYVRSSAKLFNSDTEFIKQFNELVDELVGKGKENQQLLVLFIDDIDLSTWRCMDVVRTLLSYLANKNIVTFISGDLETFEEALTLEFLRQEKALDGGILNQAFLARRSDEQKLLESKKQLAYEYLKKILPPVYRHHIKDWSLDERGKYCIQNSENGQDTPDLSDLLGEALKGWVDPAFFQYVESDGTKSLLPYTYHLFDNTSRGLNNVYNVLAGIAESRKDEKKDSEIHYIKEKKQLLDTMIASKKIYNQYRNELRTQMIIVGTQPETSKVHFDNAYAIIYGRVDEIGHMYKIENPVDRFSLFILVDFAARILYEGEYTKIVARDERYQKMKEESVWDLFWHPVIAEKVMDVGDHGDFVKENVEQKLTKLIDVNYNFLIKGNLSFNLAYYKNLPLDKLFPLYDKKNNSSSVPVDLQQDVLRAFWNAISSTAEINGTKAVHKLQEHYYEFKDELDYFLKTISTVKEQNIAIRLFEIECINAVKNPTNMEELAYRQRFLQNMIAELLKTEIENGNSGKWENVASETAWEVVNSQFIQIKDKEKLNKRMIILKIIHEEHLWREVMAEAPIEYLKKGLGEYLTYINEKLTGQNEEWILDTSCAENDWQQFLQAYDGKSITKASETKQAVSGLLPLGDNGWHTFLKGITINTYMNIKTVLKNLAQNDRVWYGQYDAWKLLNDLWEAWARPKEENLFSEKYSYIRFLFQCYYRYKMAVEFDGENMEFADMLQKIANGISEAHGYAYQKVSSNFMEKLNEKLQENKEKTMNNDELNELFSSKSDRQGEHHDQ